MYGRKKRGKEGKGREEKGRKGRKGRREEGDKDVKEKQKKKTASRIFYSFSFLRTEASKAVGNGTTRWEEPGSPGDCVSHNFSCVKPLIFLGVVLQFFALNMLTEIFYLASW